MNFVFLHNRSRFFLTLTVLTFFWREYIDGVFSRLFSAITDANGGEFIF